MPNSGWERCSCSCGIQSWRHNRWSFIHSTSLISGVIFIIFKFEYVLICIGWTFDHVWLCRCVYPHGIPKSNAPIHAAPCQTCQDGQWVPLSSSFIVIFKMLQQTLLKTSTPLSYHQWILSHRRSRPPPSACWCSLMPCMEVGSQKSNSVHCSSNVIAAAWLLWRLEFVTTFADSR